MEAKRAALSSRLGEALRALAAAFSEFAQAIEEPERPAEFERIVRRVLG